MNLQRRVTGILTSPASEWTVIAGEPADVGFLYRHYILYLAAIPALCIFVSLSVMGWSVFQRPGVGVAARVAVGSYVRSLAGAFVLALVVSTLAPRFASSARVGQALKVVAYSMTPIWVAGVVYLFGSMTLVVSLATLYGIYIFYLGLPAVMRTPADRVVPFMVVAALAAIVANVVLHALMAQIGIPAYGL
jgi:Yip1 domain